MTDVLRLTDVSVSYGNHIAVEGASFTVGEGETVALVGESGSGKTTLGRAILGIVKPSGGRIEVLGHDRAAATRDQRRVLAAELQLIFQDPYGSLNPTMKIGSILAEPLRIQRRLSPAELRERIESLLNAVGLPADAADRFPSAFSGGQRQRIAIARALIVHPKVVVCDEPTSALDVSTQAKVLELLAELRSRMALSYLFITHDLALVRTFADRVLVMRRGRIVDSGPARQLCEQPTHPYTQSLVLAAPVPDPVVQAGRRAQRQQAAAAARAKGA